MSPYYVERNKVVGKNLEGIKRIIGSCIAFEAAVPIIELKWDFNFSNAHPVSHPCFPPDLTVLLLK